MALTETKTLPVREIVAMMAALMMMNAMAIDIMLPALPEIGRDLNVLNENSRQYIVSAYLVGFAFAQLAYGPLSDRFGRKKPLLVGIAIYVIGAALCSIAPTFETLLACRVLQGVGAASTRVISVSVVRDIYGGRKMAEVMSMIVMVFLLAPVLAPSMGQIIITFAPWHYIFTAMAVFGALLIVWVSKRLPETLKAEDVRPFEAAVIASGFRIVLTNRTALFYALATALIYGALFGFINSVPQIYLNIYGLGDWFAAAFAAVAIFMSLASYLNSRFVGHYGMRRLSHGSLVGFIVVTTLWAVAHHFGSTPLPFPIFIGFFASAMFLFGWIAPNFNSLAMEPLGHVAGTASSVLGFLGTLGGGAIGALIGQMYDGTAMPMIVGFALLSIATLILVLVAEKGRLFTPHNPAIN